MSEPDEFYEVCVPFDKNRQDKNVKQYHDGKARYDIKWEHVTGTDTHVCYDLNELVDYLVALAEDKSYHYVNVVRYNTRTKVYSSGWRKEENSQWFEGMLPADEPVLVSLLRDAVRMQEHQNDAERLVCKRLVCNGSTN